ncbi:MAG TPA: hypothetical protein PK668_12700 [Myxococcota bacterium]|nr:hypothetical protein [Myxococcota bacterium]HRY93670.1 hypothetical protein [Myxococcota bacterium]
MECPREVKVRSEEDGRQPDPDSLGKLLGLEALVLALVTSGAYLCVFVYKLGVFQYLRIPMRLLYVELSDVLWVASGLVFISLAACQWLFGIGLWKQLSRMRSTATFLIAGFYIVGVLLVWAIDLLMGLLTLGEYYIPTFWILFSPSIPSIILGLVSMFSIVILAIDREPSSATADSNESGMAGMAGFLDRLGAMARATRKKSYAASAITASAMLACLFFFYGISSARDLRSYPVVVWAGKPAIIIDRSGDNLILANPSSRNEACPPFVYVNLGSRDSLEIVGTRTVELLPIQTKGSACHGPFLGILVRTVAIAIASTSQPAR